MVFQITPKTNTYNLIRYIHSDDIDELFHEGISLKGLNKIFKYEAKSKPAFKKINYFHLLSCTGPDLVSERLRNHLEVIAPNDIEFFDAKISFGESENSNFYAVNIVNKISCCDMIKSEYEVTIFDPNNPKYMFLYGSSPVVVA